MAAKNPVNDFRKSLRKSLFLTAKEDELFHKIPDAILDGIFRHNFNGNHAMAERVLFNRYQEVDRVDRQRLEQEKQNIHNLGKATRHMVKALVDGEDLLFVTDNDNDGSLAQAVLIEFLKVIPEAYRAQVHIEYAQPIGSSRGLTAEVVDLAVGARHWAADKKFTIITADNGINNRSEQNRIQATYPRSSLIITDHHLPDEHKVIEENDRTLIFNPKYQPTEYFKRKNISGANTAGVLLSSVAKELHTKVSPNNALTNAQTQALSNMDEIGGWANLLDYANADMADMPTRPYIIEKALNLRPLLNVSTSMSNLITSTFDEAAIDQIAKASQGLDPQWIRDKLKDVTTLNVFAHKILNLYHRYAGQQHTFTESDFYTLLSEELTQPEDFYTSINPNYIEQLRPVIFNLAAIDNKDMFMAKVAETMTGVFDDLRRQERDLLEGLRTVGLLRQDRRPNSTVLYPIEKAVTKLFNRRLLGKAYNEENNGFLLILSSFGGTEASGSMRSLYPMSEILEGKETIEKKLGISLDFQGHEQAAGFFVRSTSEAPVTEEILSSLNAWIDDRITAIKVKESINQLPNLNLDFASIDLITKINSAIKANLAGMWGLPAVIQFSAVKGEEVWVTDNKTTEQISLNEVVKRKRYGYQAIKTDFGGGAFVVPVEMLRAVVDSGYKKGLRLAYMDEGVFMASQVVDVEKLPNLIQVKGGRKDQEKLSDYYEKTFKDSNFMPLKREDFRNLPYFRFNKYGEREFEQLEGLMIQFLDQTGSDVLAVIDTEGTGLGKAPKCFNIGGTNITIDPSSGITLPKDQFEKNYYRGESGKEFLLSDEQVSLLTPVEEDEIIEGDATILFKTYLEDGSSYYERVAYPGKGSDLVQVTNLKEDPESDTVIYNRRINGFAFSFLVNNNDFAITQEFEDLTGIGNGMVEKLGKSASVVDKQIAHYYGQLRNAHGEPAKIIFQAHNMPYDKGVGAANFQELNQLMGEHITSDTAKIARMEKLAYDDTPVSSFDDVDGIPPKAYFYDSPYSDYSLSTFLGRVAQGKGGIYPDTTAKILLRYNPEREVFSVIDRKANQEVELAIGLSDLMMKKVNGHLPNNAVKYSVERLSSRAMIRNIMLLDKPKPTKVELLPNEAQHRSALEMFQDNYHFDVHAENNIDNFVSSLYRNEKASELLADVDLLDLATRFLEANKETQAKFHDGWIYEKVLAHHEPDSSSLRVPTDIVEQVNYYTDLPSKKIRKVFEDVIKFKRHFGVHHAIVHEQHNNIRQTSEDGQGLADTAYESVLPAALAMMKFHNPYYKSANLAVGKLIEMNVKGSLIQHMLGDEFNNELARDSYSVSQMLAFRRQGKTDVVKRAQGLASGRNKAAQLAPIKFKISSSLLPEGSAVYAQPKRHLSQEEVHEAADLLKFVLVNEQVKTACVLANKINKEHAGRLIQMADANNARCIEIREQLLKNFERIDYSRKDSETKKLSDMMRSAFSGMGYKIQKNFVVTEEVMETANQMAASFRRVFGKLNSELTKTESEDVSRLLKELEERLQKQTAEREIEAALGTSQAVETEKDIKAVLREFGSPNFNETDAELAVRTETFLPNLSIERREPLKFVLDHFGLHLFFPAIRQLAENGAKEAHEAGDGEPTARKTVPSP